MSTADDRSPQVLGIVNVTRDSFSDGGQFLDPAAAIAHAERLVAHGADYVDLGAQSTHPDAEAVSPEDEIERLSPVVRALTANEVRVSIDTFRPAVMRAMLALGAEMINDVTGLTDAESIAAVRASDARIVLMHSVHAGRGDRAERIDVDPARIVAQATKWLAERIAALERAGIRRERIIADPGMGFFVGVDPQCSIEILRSLTSIRETLRTPMLISVSRKSFIGAIASAGAPRAVSDRGAGTLAAELYAAIIHRADYIRTHDVRALRDGLRAWRAIDPTPLTPRR